MYTNPIADALKRALHKREAAQDAPEFVPIKVNLRPDMKTREVQEFTLYVATKEFFR